MSEGLVLPVYEESPEVVAGYIDSIREFDEVVLVLDSENRSDYENKLDVEILHSPTRRGKGGAIIEGMNHLDTDYKFFVDADGSLDPESLEDVVRNTKENKGLTIGSRFHRNSTENRSRQRNIVSSTFVTLCHVFHPVHVSDYQCGVKGIDSVSWDIIKENITYTGFSFDLDFIYQVFKEDIPIHEVPVAWEEKSNSSVSITTAIAMVKDLFKLRMK